MAITPNRSRLLAAAVLVVTFLVGLFLGIGVDRLMIRHRVLRMVHGPIVRFPGFGAVGFFGPGFGPHNMRSRFLDQLARDLNLSPEQRSRVDSLLTDQQRRMRAVMERTAPEMRAIVDSAHAGLKAVLTPEQWKKFEEIRERRVRRWKGWIRDTDAVIPGDSR